MYCEVTLYPGLPMFFIAYEKNQEGLVDFCDVMIRTCQHFIYTVVLRQKWWQISNHYTTKSTLPS